MAPFPDYTSAEPGIMELEDTVQICSDCGDMMASTHESCRCANCREEYEQELAQASALLETRIEKPRTPVTTNIAPLDAPRPQFVTNNKDWTARK